MENRIIDIFKSLGCHTPLHQPEGLPVHCPGDGKIIAHLPEDTRITLEAKLQRAEAAQRLARFKRDQRAALLERYAAALKEHREPLAEIIHLDGGKTMKESLGEIDGSADILLKTIKDASLPEFNGMIRCKERTPVGIVGLITSFNFPAVVAHWTIAPAWLAGNAVLWKPSEKTPLIAMACKAIADKALGPQGDLLQILIGGRDIGHQLVAHERVDMISATGSVAMGQGIKKTLAAKHNNYAKPILELGGNNGAIISDKMSFEHLEWSVKALLNSFFGTTGQRCTNTRRLFVQRQRYEKAVGLLEAHIQNFSKEKWDEYGYGPLIDADAFQRFEHGKKQAADEGGEIRFGKRLFDKEHLHAFYIQPALALMPQATPIMEEETFAPLLFVTPYDTLGDAVAMVNAPANAGLVNGIYTQSQSEADQFAAENEAGHTVINAPKGTGTPAFGMGFGGNKASGCGEILNAADPLRPFTRDHYRRIAQNKDIVMDQ